MGYLLKCFYSRGFPLVLFRKFDDAVQSDPCHDLGVRIMLWWLSCFPDSIVRFVPYLANCFTQSDQKSSRVAIKFWFRSEEHTSELQSRGHLVCRLLLEKKKTDTSFRP